MTSKETKIRLFDVVREYGVSVLNPATAFDPGFQRTWAHECASNAVVSFSGEHMNLLYCSKAQAYVVGTPGNRYLGVGETTIEAVNDAAAKLYPCVMQ